VAYEAPHKAADAWLSCYLQSALVIDIYVVIHRDEKYLGDEYTDRLEAFRTIYRENRWDSSESVSGRGSTLAYTAALRKSLARCLSKLEVETFLDAPCGDFNWMRYVTLPPETRYIGGDIISELVDTLQRAHGGERYSFHTIDIVKDPLPAADLWLCRDVLFHLPNKDIEAVLTCQLTGFIFLTTTYDFPKKNLDVKAGGFRFINLRRPPFGQPKPLLRIRDFVAPEPPRHLGLWYSEQIARCLYAGKDC
jgi:hypothetical protein